MIISSRPSQLLLYLAVLSPFAAIGAAALARIAQAIGSFSTAAALGPAWPTAAHPPGPALLAALTWLATLAFIVAAIGALGHWLLYAWQLLMLPAALALGAPEALPITGRARKVSHTTRPRQRVDAISFSLAVQGRGRARTLSFELADAHPTALRAYECADKLWVRRLRFPPVVLIDWARSAAAEPPPL